MQSLDIQETTLPGKMLEPSGILLIDKTRGCSSHDVVFRARRALKTKSIGHAGTLDPMATGVLVLGVGEGTKLLHYLTADQKEYEATIKLGVSTASLDADGEVLDHADVPAMDHEKLAEVVRSFLGVQLQEVPAVSAVKVDGERLYAKARRGEVVIAPSREVTVHELEATMLSADEITIRVRASKGFYVRSLARDLSARLGTLGHLTTLRRIRSGNFAIESAVSQLDLEAAMNKVELGLELRSKMLTLAQAAEAIGRIDVDERTAFELGQGKRPSIDLLDCEATIAFSNDRPVAIVRVASGILRVLRGLNP